VSSTNAAENAAINAIANSGRGVTSTGAAVSTTQETMVPLAAVGHFGPGKLPLGVNHQGLFVATTISFGLPPDTSLSDASAAIEQTAREIHLPPSIHGTFAGTAGLFQRSMGN
jgi:multidrug efflux pump